jgi:hypothetical protein
VAAAPDIRIELDRQRQRAIELARDTFAAMHAGFLGVANVLLAGNADGICFGLYLEVAFVDAGQLDDRQDIVALLKHVEFWS